MKKTRIIIAIALVALAASMIIGCKLEDTRTSKECMDKFAAAVNTKQWFAIKDCTHSDAEDYDTFGADEWKAVFDTGTGIFGVASYGDTAIAMKDGISYTFYLSEDGTDYYAIYRIIRTTNGSTIFE